VTTAKQTASNQANAQKSTGPTTAAGKEASAGNAYKHGLTSTKYLGRDEDPNEFAALYAARRALHLPDDAIIDDLIQKITLVHWRLNRAFRAEAKMLGSRSLDELFVDYRAPVKNLTSYEAANRKLLLTLRDELSGYEKAEAQRRATPSPADKTATRSDPLPRAELPVAMSTTTASNAPAKKEPITAPLTELHSATPPCAPNAVAKKEVAGSRDAPPATPKLAAAPSDPSAPAAPRATKIDLNPKTKPISTEDCKSTATPPPAAAPGSATRSPAAPGVSPVPTSVVQPPRRPVYQTNFDIPRWDTGRR
jgi:hypothetical protein